MREAIAEAAKGLGRTTPNPVVGAVIVKRGRIIARGHHAKAGEAHAEVVALRRAGPQARGADLYTTLEPCNHFGRTPPCTEAILSAGIRRVLSASSDPNPLVHGKGIARLRRNGVEVVTGVLREEADGLNRPFFKFIRTGLPYVTLKAAITLDGKIATETGDSRWVTGEAARLRVHHLRDQADVVMVGANTVERDDPQLTTRFPGGRNAIRLVLDSRLRLSLRHRLFREVSDARTIVATGELSTSRKARLLIRQGVEVWTVKRRQGRVDLKVLLSCLAQQGLNHVLVEGGGRLFASLLSGRLADELWLFLAPKLVGGTGVSWVGGMDIRRMSEALAVRVTSTEMVGEDFLLRARFTT
jgi:diaminohydroxyphosphoribosylaminopyrimidine deaminase / 5-amino-6-(5-phosphoribosylamino)uracil reductase